MKLAHESDQGATRGLYRIWGLEGNSSTRSQAGPFRPAASRRTRGAGGAAAGAKTEDFALVGFEDFELQAAVFNAFSGVRHVSGEKIEKAGNGCGGAIGRAGKLNAEEIAEPVHRQAAAEDEAAIGLADDVRRGMAVLFADFADNLFDEVFDGREPRDGAIFVHDDSHVLIFLAHFFEKLGAQLGFRNEQRGTHQFADAAGGGVALRDLQKVLGKNDADDVFERAFVNGQARESRFHDQLAKRFDGGAGLNGDDVRAGRHHFADALVAELDDLLEQVGLAGLDNSLFLRGFDQRFDPFGVRAGVGGGVRLLLGNAREGRGQVEQGAKRPDQQRRRAKNGDQRQKPAAGGPREKEIGNEMHADGNFQTEKDKKLEGGFGDVGDKIKNTARGFEDDQSQPKMREQIKRERALSAIEVQAGFDLRFKNVEMFVQAARGDAAEAAINMVEIGKDRQADGEKDDSERVEPDHWSGQPLSAAQTQAAAQAALHAAHLAAVGLVIVTQQMEKAMQNQNAEFERQRAAQAARVAPSGLGRNSDVAEIACSGIFPPEKIRARRFFTRGVPVEREGEDVGCAGLAPVGLIHARHRGIADERYGDILLHLKRLHDVRQELFERRDGHGDAALAIDDHGSRWGFTCRTPAGRFRKLQAARNERPGWRQTLRRLC